MDDLQTLRIQRTPVRQNSKCESCVHYDGNAASKGGACEVGSAPQICGNGSERRFGYAPLDELGPDEIDDLATPTAVGQVGMMNETGAMEPMIVMQRVVLGDEDLTIAERIRGQLQETLAKSSHVGAVQGHNTSIYADVHLGNTLYATPDTSMYAVAKAMHETYFSPRKQRKYNVGAVLHFLAAKGYVITSNDFAKAGVSKAMPVAMQQAFNVKPSKAKVPKVKATPEQIAKVHAVALAHSGGPSRGFGKSDDHDTPNVKKAIGGEGSHGGNIIGHTKSGKVIYGTHSGSAPHKTWTDPAFSNAIKQQWDRHPDKGKRSEYKRLSKNHQDACKQHVKEHAAGFTKEDHMDAARAHSQELGRLGDEANKLGYSNGGKELVELGSAHHGIAMAHGEEARKMHMKELKGAEVKKSEMPNVTKL
jgi:CBS domain-containing protein